MEVQEPEIKMGEYYLVAQDITVDGLLAFRKGERVVVVREEPQAGNPAFRYVVHSKRMEQHYYLRQNDLSPVQATPPAPVAQVPSPAAASPPASTPYCQHCGKPTEGKRFCQYCGEPNVSPVQVPTGYPASSQYRSPKRPGVGPPPLPPPRAGKGLPRAGKGLPKIPQTIAVLVLVGGVLVLIVGATLMYVGWHMGATYRQDRNLWVQQGGDPSEYPGFTVNDSSYRQNENGNTLMGFSGFILFVGWLALHSRRLLTARNALSARSKYHCKQLGVHTVAPISGRKQPHYLKQCPSKVVRQRLRSKKKTGLDRRRFAPIVLSQSGSRR
jgi:hypothetical protein